MRSGSSLGPRPESRPRSGADRAAFLPVLVVFLCVLFALPSSLAAPTSGAARTGARSSAELSHGPLATLSPGNWTNLTSQAGSPPPVLAPAGMVFDSLSGSVILFGGTSTGPAGQAVGDTWSFSGGRWTNLTPHLSKSPPARQSGAAMVYDPLGGYVLLFGGLGASGYLGDTWTFAGGAWTDHTSSLVSAPAPRELAGAAFDARAGDVLLFGGFGTQGGLSDTWTYSSGQWTQVSALETAPPGGCCQAVEYDAADRYILDLVSPDSTGTPQTWTFASGHWTNRSGVLFPASRAETALAYDVAASVVFLFGGTAPTGVGALSDAWEFTGGSWSPTFPAGAAAPTARWSPGFAYDASTSCLVLFGGFDNRGALSPDRGETWTFCGRPTNSSILVSPPGLGPQVDLTLSRTQGVVPFEVNLTTFATGGRGPYNLTFCSGTGLCENAYQWTGQAWNSSVLLTSPGVYSVSSLVTDSSGRTQAVTGAIRALAVQPLQVPITLSPLAGGAPLSVSFRATILGGLPPYTVEWNFGDGTNGSSLPDAVVIHTYRTPGSFTPTLLVLDSSGRSVNRSLPAVHVAGPPASPGLFGLPSAEVPFVLAGSVASVVAGAFVAYRLRLRQIRSEAQDLVDQMWKGESPVPDGEW